MARYAAKHAATTGRPGRDVKPKGKGGHRVLRRVVGGVAAVVVVAGLGYGAGVYYFQDHFLPNTTVNGKNVSLKSEGEVAADISSGTDGYTSTITAGDFSLTVKASDIDLKTDGATAAADALAQVNVYEWPLLALRGSDLTVHAGVSYDEQKLTDEVSSAVESYNEDAQKPQDASWSFDADSGSFEVTPQVDGTEVDRDAVVSAAVDGVGTLSGSTDVGDAAKVAASRTADDPALTAAVEKANQIASSGISLTYDGEVKASVPKQRVAQWVTIGDDLSVSVDKSAVASYVADTVAPSVKVEDEDNTYSVARKTLTSRLVESVEAGDASSVEIPMTKTAKPKATTDDEGSGSEKAASSSDSTSTADAGSSRVASLGSYIDVDLGSQVATYYDASGNVLWQSSIVSGNESERRSTPTGTYQINDKETNQTLVGADEDGDGEPDYRSHVNFWMPFIGNSVGLHDATWRGSFGGDIYETGGSHGCVNLPYSKAQQLYNMVSVGTTVYVHR